MGLLCEARLWLARVILAHHPKAIIRRATTEPWAD
jgi:hypothetical protein